MTGTVVYANEDGMVTLRPCPNCGTQLHFEELCPPAPLSVRQWWGSDDHEQAPLSECPGCGEGLPT